MDVEAGGASAAPQDPMHASYDPGPTYGTTATGNTQQVSPLHAQPAPGFGPNLRRQDSRSAVDRVRGLFRDPSQNGVQEETFLCPICFENLKVKDGFRLQGCSEHNLCRNCATAYVQTYINNGGAVREMTCPIGDECQVQFSPLDVRRLDPEQGEGPLFQRYIKFFKQQSGKHAPCPKCGFLNEGSPEQTVKMQCKECSTKYCFHHGNQHDPDKETCDQYLRRTAQAQQETDRIIQTTTSECPGCGALINKTRGCNHMTCRQCRVEHCYLCGERIGRGAPESVGQHYATGNTSGCPGMHFTNAPPRSRVRSPEERQRARERAEAVERCQQAWRPVLLVLAIMLFPVAIATTLVMMAITIPLLSVCMPFLAILEDDDCDCCPGNCTPFQAVCCCFAPCFDNPDDCLQSMFTPCIYQWRYWVWCCNTVLGDDTCDDDC